MNASDFALPIQRTSTLRSRIPQESLYRKLNDSRPSSEASPAFTPRPRGRTTQLRLALNLPPDENRPPNHGGTWNTSLRYWRLRGACRRYSSRAPEVGVSPTATLQGRAAPNCALLLSGAAKPPRSASFPSNLAKSNFKNDDGRDSRPTRANKLSNRTCQVFLA